MNVAILTPGTGSYYCGACMRDNALAKSLHAAGHEVSLLPMYLPLQLDEEQHVQPDNPIFFGGINVFLQQKLKFKIPGFLHKLLNNSSLLRSAAKRSHMTSARDHGEMALEMLRIEDSPFGQEMEQLVDWLAQEKPDILLLGTALQAGMIRTLRKRLNVRIICSFQGEDSFLDGLPEPFKSDCWNELSDRLPDADMLISPSQFYADLMRDRLRLPNQKIEVLPNGISIGRAGLQPASSTPAENEPAGGPRSAAAHQQPKSTQPKPPAEAATPPSSPLSTSHSALSTPAKRPVIGYLARMIREKGVHHLVEAFIHLRHGMKHPDAHLHIAGAVTAGDEKLVAELKAQLAKAGLTDHVTWSPNISLEEKQALLSSFTLFSVPATYPEAFGLYLIEALAAGVPVVQPDGSSFREIIARSDAGRLVEPNNPKALAETWADLLSQPEELQALSEKGRRAATEFYSVDAMRDRFLALAEPILGQNG